MTRRQLLKLSLASGLILGSGLGYRWLQDKADLSQLTIKIALQKLDNMAGKKITSLGVWSPAQIFVHIAQSIEYSMTGYPQHRSALFKNTLGRAALSAFSAKGKMSHGLSSPIPGAEKLEESISLEEALQRLTVSLIRFAEHQGTLQPHFAYGPLDKNQYRLAHLMHLNNHFEEIRLS